ncbi:YadA-like family protein [Mesosutterella multiformis]|uniref:YadA-like family protein n=1 Tax=Mesosutterella multiformis TaxID=2259133 RepID=UPI000F614CAC|nr:YadA-like family protein [Mesosutterella multiformis]GCB32270.1 hypothetical protein KGMB02707_15390 [Mesosutterella multiformis]
MRTQNKGTRSSRFRITTIAIAVASSFAMTPAWAADSDIVDKGAQAIAYDISPANDGTNIAIGKNAKVFIGGGTQESMLSFGEDVSVTNYGLSMNIHSNTDAKQNLPSGIAVGTNTYARTASIQIGDHTLEKNKIAIGDTTADKLRQLGVAATTIGTNSYTGGGFATTIGSYNVQSSPYEANGITDTLNNSTKNAFATVIGTLNSNESMTGTSSSGVANYLGGLANKVTNSNGAVVIGAGNTVKESSAGINSSAYSGHYDSVAAMQQALINGIQQSSGGATLVLGGGNQAEYTKASQLIGVNNTLKGSSSSISQYNALNGYKNTASNVNHVTVVGSENSVSDTTTAVVFGDKRTLNGADNSVIIGSSSDGTTTSVKNAVAIGTESNATVEGGVALGAGSVASTDKGKVGYDPGTKAASTNTDSTWVSTRAAVSIGDTANGITRQITGLAAGTADTDAVNVAQLKVVKGDASQAVTESKKHSSVVAGNNIKVTSQANAEGGTEYSVSTADNVSFSSVTVGAASISQAGIQAGSQKITNVAPGTISATSTDAVNGSQLYQTNQAVQQNSDDISKLYNRSAELNRKIHRAGAHAAALAALHPLDFDENHRVSASLGLGQYHSSGAAALGIFVRPTENFMVSLGGSIASGSDLMGNLGVHYRFGGDSVRVNKTELTQQVSTLTAENRDLSAKLASSNSKLEAATSKIDSLMERIHAIEAKLNMK